MRAIHAVLENKAEPDANEHVLLNHAKNAEIYGNPREVQKILNAAIALKMAMRAYASDDVSPEN